MTNIGTPIGFRGPVLCVRVCDSINAGLPRVALLLHILQHTHLTLTLPVTWCTNSLTFKNCTLYPHCIYVFCIYLRTNSDLCHLHPKLIGFYNRDERCLLRGTNWVFKLSNLRFVFKDLIPSPTILLTARDERYDGLSFEIYLASPFTPFLSHHITIQTIVSHLFYS